MGVVLESGEVTGAVRLYSVLLNAYACIDMSQVSGVEARIPFIGTISSAILAWRALHISAKLYGEEEHLQ